MRKMLIASAVTLVGLAVSGGRAAAGEWTICGPWATTAAFPSANPPGWYTNTYSFHWQYPWFAYYNYSHGPYANWMAGGGYAGYANLPGHPVTYAPWVGQGGYGSGGGAIGGATTGAPAGCAPGATVPQSEGQPVPDPLPGAPQAKTAAPGKVAITLPADAKLLFNGTAAIGTGSVRTFVTPALQPGVPYGYELTAEVTRNGKVERVTERVIVRAGETATISLDRGVVQTAGK